MLLDHLSNELAKFQEVLNQNQRFLVMSHNNPDGDTLGSNLAISMGLKNLGKQVTSTCYDKIPQKLEFLPESKNIVQEFLLEDFDALIIMDTGAKHLVSHFEMYPELNRTKKPIIIIDHHYSVEKFGDIKIINSKATSTTSLLFEIFKKFNWEVTPKIATCLLNGIYTDTGSFMHSNTNVFVLKQAAELGRLGADFRPIQINNFKRVPTNKLKLIGEVLSNIEFDPKTKVLKSGVPYETLEKYNAGPNDLDGVSDLICSYPEASYSVLYTENADGKVKASLRTRKENVNVAKIAENFGGGGHTKAAGFRQHGRLQKRVIWDIV